MSGGGGSGESETYLEAFVDQLSSLPHDLRRSLELLKSLDGNADLTRLAYLHRTYIHQHVEKRIVESLQVVELPPPRDGGDNDDHDYISSEDDAADYDESSPRVGVIVRSGPPAAADDDSAGTTKQQQEQRPKRPFRPTTQELFTFTYESQMYEEIMTLQLLCRQKADEKCAVAQQAYEMVDRQIQKLDTDMAAMEPFLKATGDLQQPAGPLNSSSSNGGNALSAAAVAAAATVRPDDMAACQIVPGSEWILAKVVEHDPIHGLFKLADEDVESNKIFDLPDAQVIVLHNNATTNASDNNNNKYWSKGDAVYAVYPDTTSFYPATITQAPNKKGYVVVMFSDDSDEFGVTTPKPVPLHHIMAPPPPHR